MSKARHLPVIFAHVPITRRKTLCHVVLAESEVAFSSAHLATAIGWLYDQGHQECILDHGGETFALVFMRRPKGTESEDENQLTMFDAG